MGRRLWALEQLNDDVKVKQTHRLVALKPIAFILLIDSLQ